MPCLLALAFGRGHEVEPRQWTAGALQCRFDRGVDLRGRRALAAADAGHDHGFTHTHCVTGMPNRHPVLPPTRSAREMAMRVSVPPSVAWRRDQLGLGLQASRH